MAGYLASYADRFALPVRTGAHVDGLFRDGEHYLLASGTDAYSADNVVLATGPHRTPRVPNHAAELSPTIRQLHAAEYRNPGQLRAGPVLVVGAGNCGVDIALEVSATHPVLLAGRHPGHLPIRIESRAARFVFPIWFAWNHTLTLRTPWGRRLRANLLGRGEGLVRSGPRTSTQRASSGQHGSTVADGRPVTADGRGLDVTNVICATGFRPDFGWIHLPDPDTSGHLAHDRGVVPGQPGLYVVGQHFQYSTAPTPRAVWAATPPSSCRTSPDARSQPRTRRHRRLSPRDAPAHPRRCAMSAKLAASNAASRGSDQTAASGTTDFPGTLHATPIRSRTPGPVERIQSGNRSVRTIMA